MREERKAVTALFADIVGSTSLTESLDPEDAREILGGGIERVIQAVEDFGGTIKDLAGDGVLALFGAPVAHEDDAERAVRAGLRIVDDVRAYAEDVSHRWRFRDFNVRVGIETGIAVLGPVGSGQRVEYGATSDALNTAARLQSAATAGSVMVGPATHRLVDALFEWGPPSQLQLKGKTEPIVAHRPERVKARRGWTRRGVLADIALVGRGRELGVALSALDFLGHGEGGVLFVVAEPGMGKSRILEEVRHAAAADATWIEGHCVSYGQSLPYVPYRDLFLSWAGALETASEAEVRSALRERVADLSSIRLDILPYLGAMLGLEPEPQFADLLRGLSPETLNYRVAESVGEVLVRLVDLRPVVVAIEDLHWSDLTSIQLTDRLLATVTTRPILFVLTMRPEPDHPSWGFRETAARRVGGRLTELSLDALPSGADRDMLVALIGEGTLPARLEATILGRAEGNPFFLEEFVRSLIDVGAVVAADGRWRLDHATPVDVPESVEKVIQSRIDRLPAEARDALDAASILGRHFGLPLLRAVSRLNGALPDALTELVRLDLLRREWSVAEPEYRFKHALIQETAYNGLLKRKRRELHLLAARALEQEYADRLEPIAAILGHHYRQAGELDRALRYLEQAGDAARRAYAVAETLDNFTAALEVAAAMGAERQTESRIRLKRGAVRTETGDTRGAAEDLESALVAGHEVGDRTVQMHAESELGFLLAGAADYRAALPRLDRALALATSLGDVEGEVTALARLAIVDVSQLDFEAALDHGQDALVAARRISNDRVLARALDSLKQVALEIGDWPRLEQIASELGEINRRHGDLWYLQFVLFEPAFASAAFGKWEEAVSRVEEALALNRRIGDRGNEPLYVSTLARLFTWSGQYDRGLTLGAEAVDMAIAVGHAEWSSWAHIDLGRALAEICALDEAAFHLEQGSSIAADAGAHLHAVRGYAQLASVEARRGNANSTREKLEEAVALIERIRTPAGHVYTLGSDAYIEAARVFAGWGQQAQAEKLLAPVIAAARQHGWADGLAYGLLVRGRGRAMAGDSAAARRDLRAAGEAAQSFRMPGAEWRVEAAMAAVSRMTGHREESETHAARAREIVQSLLHLIPDATMSRRFLEAAEGEIEGRSETW